ncbi:MAG: hypothetical protein KBD66_01320 [Candidatus Doudnabacteria bacterium]|nr:hypothetical protein [Candidatus Doudnabacteria bacterium]
MNTSFQKRANRRTLSVVLGRTRFYMWVGLIVVFALAMTGRVVSLTQVVQPQVVQADMLSSIKNWYATLQSDPVPTLTVESNTEESAAAATTASLFTAAASGSACPDGEVNLGNTGRGPDAMPTCHPCPSGTVKKVAGGQEACLPPGQTLTLSCEPDGYTFRTVNRGGPAGSRCCARQATHIAGSDVGGSGPSASGLWYCGGPGTNLNDLGGGSVPTPAATVTPGTDPTPSGAAPTSSGGGGGAAPTQTPTPTSSFSSACPDGQVNVGNTGRGANAMPTCQSCPSGTVKMTAGGQEACRTPGTTLTLSCEADGYTFRTVNRWGPSGTRCCAGEASLIPGTNVGGSSAGASGIWVCGGYGGSSGSNGGSGGAVTPVPTGTVTPTTGGVPSGSVTPTPTQGASASLCPDGQVNVGNTGRGANAMPTCQSCPSGTVKMTAGGQEACRTPGTTLTLSCEADGYTFRTVNRWGPSGTRCCAGRASLIPGTNVGGSSAGASGIWVCGGNGATSGTDARLSAVSASIPTSTPASAVNNAGYLATCSGGGVVNSTDPVIGVNTQANGSILAAVDLRGISGASIWINGRQVSGTTFTLQKGDILLVRTAQGEYVATTDTLGTRESASVLIPIPCISVSGSDSFGRTTIRITPDAAFSAGLRLGEFEVWYRVRSGSTQGTWQKFDWLSCTSNVNNCLALTGAGTVEAKVKTVSSSAALGGSGNWSLTASKVYGQ